MKIIFVKLMLLGSIALFAPSISNAQTKSRPEGGKGGPGVRTPDYTKLKTDLNLTDDQLAFIKEQDVQFKAKLDSLKSNTALTEEEKRAKMKKAFEDKDAGLKTVLSADQYAKLPKFGGDGNRGGGDRKKPEGGSKKTK